ncbi:hypothetical protein GCM10010252_19190 [Streptomyces aureoverticillatus]|nr:hypothetical protein GCM10010252_19190 [Streptomyces aureoverticillatus]
MCKCSAHTYAEHLRIVEAKQYAAHVYTGPYWAPREDAQGADDAS